MNNQERITIMNTAANTNKTTIELTTFHVGDALCGMDILQVQEINKLMEMTKVPQAPDYVKGILNLRGQIVTIIDLGKKLGLGETDTAGAPRNIIVNAPGEYIGLLVSKLDDVVVAEPEKIEPAPANMSGIQGTYFSGVFKTDNNLIGILDTKEVLRMEENINRV